MLGLRMSTANDLPSNAAPTFGARHVLAFAAVLLPVALALALHAVQGRVAGLAVDDAFYLLMADRQFGRLDGEPGLLALLATRSYPPLYPLVLGLFGGGSDALLAASIANAALILLWVACLLAWLLRAGVAPAGAALLALAVAFAPFTLYHAQVLWSEHLYLLLQMLALWRLERQPPSGRDVLLAGALVGLTLLTRTAGIALVAAFSLYLVWQRPRRWAPALALAWLPLLERFSHRASVYGGELQGVFAQGLQGAIGRIVENGAGLWQGWRDGLSMADPPALAGPAVLLLLAAAGWAMRQRQRRLDAFLVPVYLGMLLCWGYSQHAPRFLYPLFPIMAYHAWLAGVALLGQLRALPRAHLGTAIAALLAASIAVPAGFHVAQRAHIPLAPELADFKRTQMWLAVRPAEMAPYIAQALDASIADTRQIRALTPADACVHTDSPGFVMLYGHRIPYQAPWRTVEELAAAAGGPCHYVYVDPNTIDGLRDAARRERSGLRTLRASRITPPDGPAEDVGLLLELRRP
jgi:hypothetical protein